MSDDDPARLAERLRASIHRLTAGEGLTPGRVQRVGPWFLQALRASSPHAACRLILTALDELEQDKYTAALRNAFGDGDSESLETRRARFSTEHGISPHTARRWEQVTLDALIGRLVTTMQEPTSPEASDQDVLAALSGIRQAIEKQTAVLRELCDRLKRLDN